MSERGYHYPGVARRLSKLLHLKGVTRHTMAEDLGVSKGCVDMWLSGRSRPKMDVFISIVQLYGCSFDWLILGRGEPPIDACTSE